VPDIKDFAPLLDKLLGELDKRCKVTTRLNKYVEGTAPVPDAVASARLTKAYERLMGMSTAPWAALVVDTVQDRLEVGGIATGNSTVDDQLWTIWRANAMDAESKLGHHGALVDGRVFATIWPNDNGVPEIVLDSSDQMVVMYIEGRHQPGYRVAALRRWVDADTGRQHITLYRRDALFKFRESKDQNDATGRVLAGGKWWEQREEIGRDGAPEPWPLENSYGVVPVVEIATNRRLQSGPFPYACGEFQRATGLIDRINLLTFLGLVVALWMGFPLRYVVGDKILRDDDGNEIPPFESKPDEVAQFENPEAKLGQLAPADRKNLSVFDELAQLAYVTKTPAHYFPQSTGLSNISADTIRALEGGLHAKTDGIHKPQIGGGWEEVLRVAGLMNDVEIKVPPTATLSWVPRESRSLAEAADAAAKLKDILPFQVIADKYLGMGQEEIRRAESDMATSALTTLLHAAETPPAAPAPVAA
jgi:hypothetical protein